MAVSDSMTGAAAAPAVENNSTEKGVFITTQSLVTFPGASALVAIIWKVLGAVNQSWGENRLLVLIIALVVGIAIYYTSAKPGETRKDQITGLFIALFNSFFWRRPLLASPQFPISRDFLPVNGSFQNLSVFNLLYL